MSVKRASSRTRTGCLAIMCIRLELLGLMHTAVREGRGHAAWPLSVGESQEGRHLGDVQC